MSAAAEPRRSLACGRPRRVRRPADRTPPDRDRTASLLHSPRLVQASRDEPVNLSESRLRTHQHWSPANATCCQSLLLDPDATMAIDLHKRLFMLVTGRGE